MSEEILKPRKKLVATPDSLLLAEDVARDNNIHFDEKNTSILAGTLFEALYRDLVTVLDLENIAPSFLAGGFLQTDIYTIRDTACKNHIVFDDIFAFALEQLCFLTVTSSCFVLHAHEKERLVHDMERILRLFHYPDEFMRTRELVLPYLDKYGKGYELAHLSSRAMLVFILCHEIAHCSLGHIGSLPSRKQETDADIKATEYFLKIMEYGHLDNQTHIHIDSKIAFAPLLLCNIFNLYETWTGHDVENRNHPPALERLSAIESKICPFLNSQATGIYSGLENGLNEIILIMNE